MDGWMDIELKNLRVRPGRPPVVNVNQSPVERQYKERVVERRHILALIRGLGVCYHGVQVR